MGEGRRSEKSGTGEDERTGFVFISDEVLESCALCSPLCTGWRDRESVSSAKERRAFTYVEVLQHDDISFLDLREVTLLRGEVVDDVGVVEACGVDETEGGHPVCCSAARGSVSERGRS